MALSISEVLDKLIAREDTKTSINSQTVVKSAVAQLLAANNNPVRQVANPVAAYSTLTDPTFSTWDNSSTKTAQSLAGDIGEMVAAKAYAIVMYPNDYDVDINAFPQQFALAMANGFAKYIDDRVVNTATTGVIAVVSGAANVRPSTSATSYALYTDLAATMGLVNADGYEVNGILSQLSEDANILSAVSTTGQPIFSTDANGQVARLLGRPFAESRVDFTGNVRFIVGDWTKLTVAIVNDLKFEKFNSGIVTISGTDHNLIQENAVAVRAEARMMFKVTQANAFAYLYG